MVDRHHLWVLVLAGALIACGEDPKQDSGEDTPSDCTPVADAGPDQQVALGDSVDLDAAASQACDDGVGSATYTWSFDSVPEGSILDDGAFSENASAEALASSFTPDVVGTYLLALQLVQGEHSSTPDVTIIEVEPGGEPPIADCGGDLEVGAGERAVLDGSQSYDPEGEALSYAWSMGAVPDGSTQNTDSIFDATTAEASFVPDLAGAYSVYLVVADGQQDSEVALCTVTATTTNQPPVADAGEGGVVPPCDEHTFQLDGFGSYDPEGQPISYEWTLMDTPEGSAATDTPCDTGAPGYLAIDDPQAPDAIFTWDIEGSYTLQLRVNDGAQWSAPDVVIYEVSDCP
jgi:hypothetical protein